MADAHPDAGLADPAVAAAALAQQQHHLHQQVQAALEGVYNRLGALEIQHAPAPAAAYAAAPSRDKPPKPETFKGTTEQATHVRMWVTMVKNYFVACGTLETQQLPYAVALLRDAALVWYQNLEGADVPATFEAFCRALVEYYQPISAQMAARDELANLKQTGSVKAYTDTFKRIAANIPDLSASEKIDRYERGLHDGIRIYVALADPHTFEDWVKRAEKADEIINKRISIQTKKRVDPNAYKVFDPFGPSLNLYKSDRQRDTASPMDIGAVGEQERTYADAAPPAKISDKEREALKKAGACFYCRKPGHVAARCPKKLAARIERCLAKPEDDDE